MSWVTFAYTRYPMPPSDPFPEGHIVSRPMLIAVLSARGRSFRCPVCLDTGADHCVFPASILRRLGFDPLQLRMHLTGGVGSVANTTYYADLEIEIPAVASAGKRMRFPVYAGFTPGLDSQGIAHGGANGCPAIRHGRMELRHPTGGTVDV